MTPYIVVVAILFAVSFSLMIFFTKSVWLKLLTVAILFVISNQVYFGFESIKGWPTEEKLEGSGQLLWAVVNEPAANDPGAIYLWVYVPPPEDGWYEKYVNYHPEEAAPRAVKIPYTENTAEQINKAKQAMEDGYAVEVDFSKNQVTDGSMEEEGNSNSEIPSGAEKGDTSSTLAEENMPRFKIVDPREVARKGRQ